MVWEFHFCHDSVRNAVDMFLCQNWWKLYIKIYSKWKKICSRKSTKTYYKLKFCSIWTKPFLVHPFLVTKILYTGTVKASLPLVSSSSQTDGHPPWRSKTSTFLILPTPVYCSGKCSQWIDFLLSSSHKQNIYPGCGTGKNTRVHLSALDHGRGWWIMPRANCNPWLKHLPPPPRSQSTKHSY